MIKDNLGKESLQSAQRVLKRQSVVLITSFILPPILILGVIGALFYYQGKLYPNNWYNDPFSAVIISIFVIGQILGLYQYITYFLKTGKLNHIIDIVNGQNEIKSTDDVERLTENIKRKAKDSDDKTLFINWLQLALANKHSATTEITENAFNRQELKKEKVGYLHILINRITLKLGFLGTLIGLLMTFPAMKSAILGLNNSNGEMTFITDIARAIDGDQYAILTTMIATVLSLMAEFITIQLITRSSINFEIIMSHLTDWYQTTIVPIFEDDSENEELSRKKRDAEQAIAENLVTLTALSQKTAVELEKMVTFQEHLSNRVHKLNKYEESYRSFLSGKAETTAPAPLKPNELG